MVGMAGRGGNAGLGRGGNAGLGKVGMVGMLGSGGSVGLGKVGIAGIGGNVSLGNVGMVGIVGTGGGAAGSVSSKWRAAKHVWLPEHVTMSTDKKKKEVEAMVVCVGRWAWVRKI
ncbi:hypothetical protein AAC387_Pa06g1576 [Persea americana]